MIPRFRRTLVVLALTGFSAGPLLGAPATPVDASPQRPSKSSNASTTARGYFELEAGWTHDNDDFGMPIQLKLGLSPRTEVYLGLVPLIGIDVGGKTQTGLGDTLVGGKIRFFESPDGDAAIEGFMKVPTADEAKGLGTGDIDAGFRFIASRTWGRNHYDFNLGGDFASIRDSGANSARWTTILTWSHPWSERGSSYGELFIQFLPADDFETITTDWGLSYRVNPSFVLDAGVNVGISEDAPDYQLVAGLTKVLGRAFSR